MDPHLSVSVQVHFPVTYCHIDNLCLLMLSTVEKPSASWSRYLLSEQKKNLKITSIEVEETWNWEIVLCSAGKHTNGWINKVQFCLQILG